MQSAFSPPIYLDDGAIRAMLAALLAWLRQLFAEM